MGKLFARAYIDHNLPQCQEMGTRDRRRNWDALYGYVPGGVAGAVAKRRMNVAPDFQSGESHPDRS